MMQPDKRVVQAAAGISRQFPEFVEWVYAWQQRELEQLPSALNNPAVAQGRCQVLGELSRFLKDAPTTAARL